MKLLTFCRKAKALASRALHGWYEKRLTVEDLLAEADGGRFTWIGAGGAAVECCAAGPDFPGMQRAQNELPALLVEDENWRFQPLAPDTGLVIGRFRLTTIPESGLVLSEQQRATFLLRADGEAVRLCHIHISSPAGRKRRSLYAFDEPAARREYMGELAARRLAGRFPELTKRQVKVLCFLMQGLPYKDIADAMNITPRTVRYYVTEIERRLHAENRTLLIETVLQRNTGGVISAYGDVRRKTPARVFFSCPPVSRRAQGRGPLWLGGLIKKIYTGTSGTAVGSEVKGNGGNSYNFYRFVVVSWKTTKEGGICMKMKKAYAAALAAAMVLTAGFSVQAQDLDEGSTVGGKPIATTEALEGLQSQVTNVAIEANTALNGTITNGERIDNLEETAAGHTTAIEGLQSQVTDVAKQADKVEAKADGALKVQGNGVLYNHGTDLTTGINLNTSAIEQEVKDRESGDAQLQSQLDEHKSWIDQANGDISGAIAVNEKQQTQIDDMQGQLDEHKSWIDQANGDISGAIAVNEKQQDQINAIDNQINGENGLADAVADAEAKADGALKVQGNGVLYNHGTDLTTGINLNTSAIEQEVKDRENADKQLSNAITNNSHRIDSLSGRVDDLGGEIDNVGAISAALAGLHPLDYDGTGSKFQLAAAMGSYDGSQAAAIGGFYHFNEDVMMSVGGATAFDGDNKSAFNVGVSFRVGQGSSGKKVNSDDVLAQLNAMNEKIAALEAENQQLSEKVAALEGGEGAEAAEAE